MDNENIIFDAQMDELKREIQKVQLAEFDKLVRALVSSSVYSVYHPTERAQDKTKKAWFALYSYFEQVIQ